MKFRSIDDLKNLKNKTILFYCDFNVDIVDNNIVDDRKIREIIDSLEYLSFSGAKVLLFSKENNTKKIEFVLTVLNKFLKLNYDFQNKIVYCNSSEVNRLEDVIKLVSFGDIIVVNDFNTYIDKINKIKSSHNILKKIVSRCDYFVFENFNDLYTDDYFIVNFSKKIKTFFGYSFLNKLNNYARIQLEKGNSVAVVGGEYNVLKFNFIENLLSKGVYVLLGGEVSSVFVSVYKNRLLNKIKNVNKKSSGKVLNLIKKYKNNIILPIDFMVSENKDKKISNYRKNISELNKYDNIYDIGPETIKSFIPYIKRAKYLIWSGLLGFVENKKFSHGSMLISQLFCNRSKGPSFGVVVGNRTCNFLNATKYGDDVDFCFYEKETFYRLINDEETNIKI